MTPGQKTALDTLWPRYGLETRPDQDLLRTLGCPNELVVEIGFGNGDALLELAGSQPDTCFIGIDVHPPGIGRLLAGIEQHRLANVRVMRGDALDIFELSIPEACLARINIWFPDPWPKKKHRKRRLVQAANLARLVRRLRPGGILHLATDWEDYAQQMLEVTGAQPALRNLEPDGGYCRAPTDRPVTRFESRGRRLGHGVWELMLERTQSSCETVREEAAG